MNTATKEQKVYQVYKSSLQSHTIIMPKGKQLRIFNYQYITDNEEEIEYLDYEISQGFIYLEKMDKVTSEDLDPMAALKRKIIADYEAEKAAAAAKVQNDLGTTGVSGQDILEASAKTVIKSNEETGKVEIPEELSSVAPARTLQDKLAAIKAAQAQPGIQPASTVDLAPIAGDSNSK